MTEQRARVFLCRGPPVCLLQDDDAVQAMLEGCPWCRVEEYDPEAHEWKILQDPKEN